MRKFFGIAMLLGLFSVVSAAQEIPKPEVFGGYQFTSTDGGWHGSGWNGAANFYITRWLGVTGDFSGVYGSGRNLYTFTGGPMISTRKGSAAPFAHALFGGAHAGAGSFGDGGLAMLFGGGVDFGKKKLAVRAIQVDWMLLRFNSFTDKNNVRINTGLMYRF